MIARPFAFALAPARMYQRLTWLTVAGLLTALLITLPPILRPDRTAPVSPPIGAADTPARPSPMPASPQIPPGLGPVLNATLAADSTEDYAAVALAASPDALHADNPAQRFATTFDTDGVHVARGSDPAVSLRATGIVAPGGALPIAAVPPASVGPRVEYRREGLTEWYVNGPRGLEQGFTVAAPPASAEQFTLGLAVVGAVPTQGADGALLLGDLRYGDLTVTDAAGATLPAHLDVTESGIGIAVDATGATWPVTVDPTITQATLTPQTPPGNTTGAFGFRSALASANGTTTVVVGAPFELVGSQDDQGAAYVFTGSGGTYTQVARLVASDGVRQKQFGISVAVTINGGTTTIAVGADHASKVYVFTGSGSTYTEQARLVPPDPTNNDDFGYSIAAAMNGGATVIAVGADIHTVGGNSGVGSVYVFAGSGSSYPLQAELNDAGGTPAEGLGVSVALASNGGINTVVAGAPNRAVNGVSAQGAVVVFTGSGTSYSQVALTASDGGFEDGLGQDVAVGVQGGITTIAVGGVGATGNISRDGAVWVFTGSGTSYTQMTLTDANGVLGNRFGLAVAVGFGSPIGPTLIAVGAPGKSSNTAGDGVILFSCAKGTCIQSSLPEANGTLGDYYGSSLAMLTAANGDMTLLADVPGIGSSPGAVALLFTNEAPSLSSVTPVFGDGSQTVASPAGTFSGTPFQLVAGAVNNLGFALPSTGVTFTVHANGGARGVFNAGDPNSTSVHVNTHDGSGGTTAGETDTINLYPSSTTGTFTVTALADGTTFSTTYTLTIISSIPKPTINPVISGQASGATTATVRRNAVGGQPAGLSPAMVTIDPTKDHVVAVRGTGFIKRDIGPLVLLQLPHQNAISLDVTFVNANELLVNVNGTDGVFNGLTTDTTAQIYVVNPPSVPNGNDGGFSDPVPFQLAEPRPAPAGSTLSCSGATTLIVPPDSFFVPPPCQVLGTDGNPVPQVLTGVATGFVQITGGELIGSDSASLIGSDSAGIISSNSGGIISSNSGGVISNDGGSIISSNSGGLTGQGGVSGNAMKSAPLRNATNHPAIGNYAASTDANGIIMAPPVLSNGVPGTYSRTLAVDGIAQPVTYTITNLNPNDGHPATITSLSRTSAHTGDPAFVLTVTGTGFVAGSVLSYGGVQLATTVSSATQVSATVPANLLKYSGSLGVIVINPDPYGGASLPATFTVTVVVNPLPPPQPTASPVTGSSPLPGSRQPAGPPLGNPNPLPPPR